MIDHSFSSIDRPCTLFETVGSFNNTSADDMQYGDMDEHDLLSLGLNDVSMKVDPYRLIRYDLPRINSFDGVVNSSAASRKISHEECVDILFKEMKEHSKTFSFLGEHQMLIEELIEHFRFGGGRSFYSPGLNLAFHKRINNSDLNSPAFIINNILKKRLNSTFKKTSLNEIINELKNQLLSARLTKFNLIQDRFNGLGISVHDIAAQKITLLRLQRYLMGWSATINFEAQDHFGLDVTDIKSKLYSQFRFFRIWFFLQRHRDFAFKPFFTNFNTVLQVGEY